MSEAHALKLAEKMMYAIAGNWGGRDVEDALPYAEAEVERLRLEARRCDEGGRQHRRQQGSWPAACEQRAFVDGACWWQAKKNGSTAFASERDEMEAEAVRRYGSPATDCETK